MASDNKLLGQFDLTGFPHVSAKDKATGREQSVVIQSSSGLSDTDVDRLVKEAEKYQAADKARKESTEVRNDADSLLYSTERSLAEHRAKLDADTAAAIEKAMAEAREAMGKEDVEQLREKVKALQTASMKIGQAVYAKSGASGDAGAASGAGAGAGAGDAKPDEKEAEFKDKPKA